MDIENIFISGFLKRADEAGMTEEEVAKLVQEQAGRETGGEKKKSWTRHIAPAVGGTAGSMAGSLAGIGTGAIVGTLLRAGKLKSLMSGSRLRGINHEQYLKSIVEQAAKVKSDIVRGSIAGGASGGVLGGYLGSRLGDKLNSKDNKSELANEMYSNPYIMIPATGVMGGFAGYGMSKPFTRGFAGRVGPVALGAGSGITAGLVAKLLADRKMKKQTEKSNVPN